MLERNTLNNPQANQIQIFHAERTKKPSKSLSNPKRRKTITITLKYSNTTTESKKNGTLRNGTLHNLKSVKNQAQKYFINHKH